MTFFMKDDVNDDVFNGTLKTLIFLFGCETKIGCGNAVTSQRLGDHATHFKSWIKKPITQNSI
jgi:hypothetical protein